MQHYRSKHQTYCMTCVYVFFLCINICGVGESDMSCLRFVDSLKLCVGRSENVPPSRRLRAFKAKKATTFSSVIPMSLNFIN